MLNKKFKIIWFLNLLILVSISSCQSNKRFDRIFFGGQIINPSASFVTLYKDNKTIDCLSLNNNFRFFKYYDFFVSEFVIAANWSGWGLNPDDYLLNLLLPVGISFYTFQTMAYSIDIYRGDIEEPETNFSRFALYVAFFPQLVAGPVERAPHLLPQFSQPFRLNFAMVKEGLFLILLGFIKKVVIADRLALVIEPYYESLATNSVDAVLCMLLFTCQIYVDFSSYSDIAIGLGLLLGS